MGWRKTDTNGHLICLRINFNRNQLKTTLLTKYYHTQAIQSMLNSLNDWKLKWSSSPTPHHSTESVTSTQHLDNIILKTISAKLVQSTGSLSIWDLSTLPISAFYHSNPITATQLYQISLLACLLCFQPKSYPKLIYSDSLSSVCQLTVNQFWKLWVM